MPDTSVVIGTIDSLYSEILQEQRTVFISLPKSSSDRDYSPVNYPVIYLLDGDDLFHSVSGIIQFFSAVKGNKVLPEMIVVGISNISRERDFTPTKKGEVIYSTGESGRNKNETGGAENFINFMERELIPYVEQKYPVSSYRTLIGHSYGGLLTVNTLLNHQDVFDNYVAIRTLFNFSNSLEACSGCDLNFKWKYYPEESHASVCLPTTYDALRFLFSWYKIKNWDQIALALKDSADEEIIEMLTSHFANVSKQMGYEVLPPERIIDDLGSRFLGRRPDLAYLLLQMNLANYSDSFHALCAMGDYYQARREVENSIHYFTKALEMKDDAEILIRLEQLKSSEVYQQDF